MQAPAPTQFAAPLAPATIVQIAVQTLALRGFTVTTSDATNGIAVATHPVPLGSAKDLLACRWGPDAIGWRTVSGTMAVTVTARAAPGGSAVSIIGTTRTAARLGYGRVADPDAESGDCVSNGTTERAIAEAIRAPT